MVKYHLLISIPIKDFEEKINFHFQSVFNNFSFIGEELHLRECNDDDEDDEE